MLFAPLRRSGHWPSLLAALVYFDISFMVWLLLGSLGPYVASDLRLSATEKGLVVAIPALGGAAFRLLLGALGDRIGVRRVGLAGLAVTVVPLAWGALAGGSLPQLIAIGLLLGIAGASFAVALPLASRWYPAEHQGLALGVVGAGNSGTVVGALVAPRLAENIGWHGAFGVAILPVAAAFVVFVLAAKEPPRRGAPSAPLTLARAPDARRLGGIYAVTFGGFVGLAAYLPMFFVDRFGMAKVTSVTLAAGCSAAGSLLRPLGGLLADRHGGARVLARAFVLVACASVLVAAAPGIVPTAGGLFVLLAALGLGNGAVFQLVPERFPLDVGSVTGLVGAAGGLGGFVVPIALGTVHQATGSFAPAFVAFAAVALLARRATDGEVSSARELALEVAA